MGMLRLDYIRHAPGIGDYNRLVDAVNWLINKAQEKKEVIPVTIEREVKDYSFFLWGEVELPYEANFILVTPEDATEVFWAYAFTYKEIAQINDAIVKGKIVSLEIKVTEKVTEKEKKQEVVFETIQSVDLDEPIKTKWKRGRKRKNSRN